MAELPTREDGIESRSFLLTLLKDGRVKAERIRAEDDPRLSSKAPFALMTVDSFLLTDDEMNFADTAGLDVARLVDGVGQADLLRPRTAKSFGDISDFFLALGDATEDTTLEIIRAGGSEPEWRVCEDRV